MPVMYLMFIAFSAASCNQTQAAPAGPAAPSGIHRHARVSSRFWGDMRCLPHEPAPGGGFWDCAVISAGMIGIRGCFAQLFFCANFTV